MKDIAYEIFGKMRYLTPEENQKKSDIYRKISTTMPEFETELTPEEAKEFVTFGSLEQIIKKTIEGIAKQDEISWEANRKCLELVVDQITDRINTERYERLRFEHFIIGLICSVNLLSKEKVLENYKQYCEEFDKLNKNKSTKECNI